MNIFEKYKISYKDIIQFDGAYATCHVNYNKSPIFNGVSGKEIFNNNIQHVSLDNVLKDRSILYSVRDVESNLQDEQRLLIWKRYWLEYINAFDKMLDVLPDSIATIYIGRHAIELGLKYLIKMKDIEPIKEHSLKKLVDKLMEKYNVTDDYMKDIKSFCDKYSDYIEEGYAEYFRYSEYNKKNKDDEFFAGYHLDIGWLSYNFAVILLKLIHFSGLDDEFVSN